MEDVPSEPKTDTDQSRIPVFISYEIIRLFSEGLYQSPQKAVEELVSNSYDAKASTVRVILPEQDDTDDLPPLWVVDDGTGMDAAGFHALWRVADSPKVAASTNGDRPPIGQFGIGKLAAYVLAHRLVHVSKVGNDIRATTMNFRDLEGRHQYEESEPFELELRGLSLAEASDMLRDIRDRDPDAWALLFGESSANSWTVAGMSDFKSLYDKLSAGRLKWVLETGLPLHSDFSIFVDGERLESSKEAIPAIAKFDIGGAEDESLAALKPDLGVTSTGSAIEVPGIAGEVTGTATIFEKRLTEGKSDRYSRSHGFFVRVRGRIINLEDELFGLPALNHAAWARFSMEITADGLRDHLLSSREGVRESTAIDTLRSYLHAAFNVCRRKYEDWEEKQLEGLDLDSLLRDAPSLFVTEPMIAGVENILATGAPSYYIDSPDLEGQAEDEWLAAFVSEVQKLPIARVEFEPSGMFDRALRFVPERRALVMNSAHPYVEKLLSMGRTNAAATLFGSSELLLDLLLQDHGLSAQTTIDLLSDRDKTLRLLAGDQPSTAAEILRLLKGANRSDKALERAIGAAFRSLGFEYERRGGYEGGTDGVLFARLGRGASDLDDYKVVYDAKQTGSKAVKADKVKVSSLEDFRLTEDAQFGFFLAEAYAAQDDSAGKLNKEVVAAVEEGKPVTLLTIGHLRRLVEIHYQYGVTLTDIRTLLSGAHTVPEVDAWLDGYEEDRRWDAQVPLRRLLEGIEVAKGDKNAQPNIKAVRVQDRHLQPFTPDRLLAALRAVETLIGTRWIEVDSNSYDVRVHHTSDQIIAEVERVLRDLFGVNAISDLLAMSPDSPDDGAAE